MISDKICIFGFGGFAREVYWLAGRLNYQVDAFIDTKNTGHKYCGVPIVDSEFFDCKKHKAVVAVGSPQLRRKIAEELELKSAEFAKLIHPSVAVNSTVSIGKGSVICANCILTCDLSLGDFTQLNLSTTIGHDVRTGDFLTTAPGVHINGNVDIGDEVYFGSNSSTVHSVKIASNIVVGAGACVAKDLDEPGTYVGVPAKKR